MTKDAERLTALAFETRDWAIKVGCCRAESEDGEPLRGEIQDGFTITPSKNPHRYCWTKQFDEPVHYWKHVQMEMLRLAVPIAFHYQLGYYIGKPGEQGYLLGTAFNHIDTRLETLADMAERVAMSHQWHIASPFMSDRVKKPYRELDVNNLLRAVFEARGRLLDVIDKPRQIGWGEFLALNAGSKDDDEGA